MDAPALAYVGDMGSAFLCAPQALPSAQFSIAGRKARPPQRRAFLFLSLLLGAQLRIRTPTPAMTPTAG